MKALNATINAIKLNSPGSRGRLVTMNFSLNKIPHLRGLQYQAHRALTYEVPDVL